MSTDAGACWQGIPSTDSPRCRAIDTLVVDLTCKARLLRALIVSAAHLNGRGYIAAALSVTDIIVTLSWHVLRIDPHQPGWVARDRFVLSKGHGCLALYGALAAQGFFMPEELLSMYRPNSRLEGHPHITTPGVDVSSGSLGYGLSIGVGMALGGRLADRPYRVYVLLGDGEVQEGSVWQAAMSGAHYQLDSLIAIVDCNGFQASGRVDELMGLGALADKWRSFGWRVLSANGHDIRSLVKVFETAQCGPSQPTVILAQTCKGHGVSFMENRNEWSSKIPTSSETESALQEILGQSIAPTRLFEPDFLLSFCRGGLGVSE